MALMGYRDALITFYLDDKDLYLQEDKTHPNILDLSTGFLSRFKRGEREKIILVR